MPSVAPQLLLKFSSLSPVAVLFFFFFNAPPSTTIYTLSLHDALPIFGLARRRKGNLPNLKSSPASRDRSEEHTSELQSRGHLVCRLLLEKKKTVKRTSRVWGDHSAQ